MNESDRLPLSDALDVYSQHLGLPDRFARTVKSFAYRNADDVIWLSDQPLAVHRDGSNSAVNLDELNKLLETVDPIIWPDAKE